jgi:hypothetical protein
MKLRPFFQLLKPIHLIFIIILVALGSCQKTIKETVPPSVPPGSSSESHDHEGTSSAVAVDWYNMQIRVILHATPAYSNIVTIRLFAYTGISLYESLRYIIPHSRSLHNVVYQMPVMPEKIAGEKYIWEEVANATMAAISRRFFPVLSVTSAASIDSLENAYNIRLMEDAEDGDFARSQQLGRDVAQAVFNFAQTDLFNLANSPGYVYPAFTGAWVPTPPAFAPPAVPHFGNVRPFLQNHSTGLTIAPPFPYSTNPSSNFYLMVKDIYDVSFSRTIDQTNMALFWNDVGAGTGYTPSGHAINILNHIITNEHIRLATAVLAYVKAGMGMWDGAIMCWRSKFTYSQIRPVTYIRSNINSTWLPLIPTPAHPEYPAAHAFVTTSTMVAISGAIGNNHYVDDHTYDFLGFPHRTFHTLYSIGVESGMSRRFGGIHYLPSILVGINIGKQVGNDIGRLDLGGDHQEGDDGEGEGGNTN